VIGLRINVMRLLRVREARIPSLGVEREEHYIDRRFVANEVNNANRLMEKRRWHTIDVSYLAIEEIAREIMNLRWPTRKLP
jgi:regulator of PEP synthase PpsR (kinase-PPPase family)